MSEKALQILLVEDSAGDARLIREMFREERSESFVLTHVSHMSQAEIQLQKGGADIVLLDMGLPDGHGLDTLRRALAAAPNVPVIMLTGLDDEELAAEAMKEGAQDYLIKGQVENRALPRALRHAIERQRLQVETDLLRAVQSQARKQAELELGLLAERLLMATAVAKVGVWEWDIASNTLTWDATMFAMYGLTPMAHMPYIVWSATVHPADLALVEATMCRAIAEEGEHSVEFRIVMADGTVKNISATKKAVLDRSGNAVRVIGVNFDVTERRRVEEDLRCSQARMTHLAEHDFLTDLPNRRVMRDRIDQAIKLALRNNKKVALLFLDLDGFKHINDSLGHPIGDRLLQSVAKRLVDCVRASDTVSRQGGDEFLVLLPEVEHPEGTDVAARKMLELMASIHTIDQHDLHITTCIGISIFPDDGLDTDTLIKNADTAMYQAKEKGSSNYRFFHQDMNVRAVERQFIEQNLRRALERQELTVHYQPQVNLKDGTVTGVEALLRWIHPTRGLIPPSEFIPVAEECGLIQSIGMWVLREACRQSKAWGDSGLPRMTMAVNVSCRQFQSESFLEDLLAILRETNMDPRFLELEVTESLLMTRPEFTASILQILRQKGVQVAIDDFGTGYSSLSYLHKFPLDTLKIDQSFIRQITSNPEGLSMVSSIINVGRSLDLRIVAEGVETEEELAFLRAQGCEEAQGYYFGHPVSPESVIKLIERIRSPEELAVPILWPGDVLQTTRGAA